jgi:hypothetical protein
MNAARRGKCVSVPITNPEMKMTTYLPTETRVLNTRDGEPGSILGGFAYDPAIGWTEYGVATRYGIERWMRSDMISISELGAD